MRETLEAYVARKKAKGTFGNPKPNKWRRRTVLTGICPCDCHPGEPMLQCDPDYDDCQCCHEVCS